MIEHAVAGFQLRAAGRNFEMTLARLSAEEDCVVVLQW